MIDETHDGSLTSWVPGAQEADGDFPIQNLPFGAFVPAGGGDVHLAVAIGDCVLDLLETADSGLLEGLAPAVIAAARSTTLNALMALGPTQWRELRRHLSRLLRTGAERQGRTEAAIRRCDEIEMVLPVSIGDYTDFYTSLHHATNAGKLFRPDNPLFPNFTHLPVAYHGRASSVVVSGHPVRRPWGQMRGSGAPDPVFAPTQKLDFELELGTYVGVGNPLGVPVAASAAQDHVFGMCVLNDWSARDIQAWEYQPLGPFLGKSFLTSVSPWVVTFDALAPFRVPPPEWPDRPPTLAYLQDGPGAGRDALAIEVQVAVETEVMRHRGMAPATLARAHFVDQYWTVFQMVVHHTSNGCNLRPGDLLGTGTISGTAPSQAGCLLEKTLNGSRPVDLPSGEQRSFLEDGDEIIMSARCVREGFVPIGFGECRGRVGPAVQHGDTVPG